MNNEIASAQKIRCIFKCTPGVENGLFREKNDVTAEGRTFHPVLENLFFIMDVYTDFVDANGKHFFDDRLEHRLSHDREERFGNVIGDGPKTLAVTCGEDETIYLFTHRSDISF